MKSFFQWFLVVLLSLFALGAFKESIVGGLLLAATAAIAAPPLWQRVSARTGFRFRKAAIAVLGIAGMTVWIASPGFQARMAQDAAKRRAEEKQAAAARPAPRADTEKPQAKHEEEAQQQDSDDVRMADIHYETLSKEQLIDSLRDPESVKFREVFRFAPKIGGETRYVYCGEVNAKNGFGGYSGFQPFIAFPTMAVTSENASDFRAAWRKLCTGPSEKTYW